MPKDFMPGPNRLCWLVLTLVVLGIVTYVRLRLLSTPLERDEGEYAYAGQLMLQGVPPYQDLYSMKWPGTFGAYALIMGAFGQSNAAIHFGLLLVTLGTAVLLFLLTRNIYGPLAGAVAAATYAMLSILPASFGLAAHATHFIVLPALGGLLLIQKAGDRLRAKDDVALGASPVRMTSGDAPRGVSSGSGGETSPQLAGGTPAVRLFLGGALLGLATLMKQAGAAFGLFAGFWVLWRELTGADRNWRRLAIQVAWLSAGFCLPLLATGLLLAGLGVFQHFWQWTFEYARAYVGLNSWTEGLQRLEINGLRLVRQAPGLWALAAAGLIALFGRRDLQAWRAWGLAFLLCSFLAACPGGYFRGHYFLVLFPALGFMAGVAVEAGVRWLRERGLACYWTALPLVLFGIAAGWCLCISRMVYFKSSPEQVCRAIYGANPFPEAVEIGRYLETNCPANARVAVIGSEPEIYFYSHRRSATGYVYTYPLLERQPYAAAMQAEMIQELTKAAPAYFVFVSHPSSWLPQTNSDFTIMEWFIQYQQTHLEPVGCVDIFPDGRTQYSWSPSSRPSSDKWVQIYRRRDAP